MRRVHHADNWRKAEGKERTFFCLSVLAARLALRHFSKLRVGERLEIAFLAQALKRLNYIHFFFFLKIVSSAL